MANGRVGRSSGNGPPFGSGALVPRSSWASLVLAAALSDSPSRSVSTGRLDTDTDPHDVWATRGGGRETGWEWRGGGVELIREGGRRSETGKNTD